jgi:hypothetical protein
MKKNFMMFMTAVIILSGIISDPACYGQDQKEFTRKYLTALPSGKPESILQKYRMTAVYINRDLYGKFLTKTKVTGDYTRGLNDSLVEWNNVLIANSGDFNGQFPEGIRQEYMENMKYVPSEKMVQTEAFKSFPSSPENILARNLIWDMLSFEIYSWMFLDSLKLNIPYTVKQINGEFDMAEIGKYNHNKILVCWKGISEINGELCAVIDFDAIDNLLELTLNQVNAKGTEQYWGTVWMSLKTKNIEQAYMYSGTMLEAQVPGMPNKFLIKTVRELHVDKIQ